ncbi:MAG: hypothetical protein JW986_01210 [Methanotrichaceae archaeon]|nr:hypothetical protein [Methanotrichaceae archaeon]
MSVGRNLLGEIFALSIMAIVLFPLAAVALESSSSSNMVVFMEPSPQSGHLGDVINITYNVSNLGSMNVTNVTLYDILTMDAFATGIDLFAGDNITLYRDYTVSARDYDPAWNPHLPSLALGVEARGEADGFPVISACVSPIRLISD